MKYTEENLKEAFKAGQESVEPKISYERWGDMEAYPDKEISYTFDKWLKRTLETTNLLKKNKMKTDEFNIEINVSKRTISSNEEAIRQLQNAIYKVAAVFYECIGEHNDMLRGNGHHMAQDLSEKAKEIWIKQQTIKK